MAAVVITVAILLSALLWWHLSSQNTTKTKEPQAESSEKAADVALDAKNMSNIQVLPVTTARPNDTFTVAATVEPNQQQLQQITPLVSGRVSNIYVSLGDHVTPGTLLVRIDSPQVAELHGKLHEAETRLQLAKMTLARVQESANRVNILKAKANLDEAEATLRRTQQLVTEGLTAKKELVAAQSQNDRAIAEYNFQKDISLNREVSEAKAELKMASTEAEHIKDGLRALDAHLPNEGEGAEHDISSIELKSPISGVVIERAVNPGAGFEQGKPLLTIANTSTLWVIANVPEKQMVRVAVGSPARIVVNQKIFRGRVNYVDPRLNEDTRTARVRIEIDNPGNKLQVGSFAQVQFEQPSTEDGSLYVPESAVQTIDGKSVVFVKESSGQFAIRKVEVSPAVSGLVPVISGLKAGELVAADGSFILKSKVLRERFGDSD
ncbi:MAG: efflux RND transporter periplasmic adaptor subunit [Candidatus Obscuribacter sp.]|nr:efflux RND transporter periplasmic adaptor subunit [Candidatus Obscuribacter sp.]